MFKVHSGGSRQVIEDDSLTLSCGRAPYLPVGFAINKLRTQDSVLAPQRIEILAIDYIAESRLECHIYYTFQNLCRTTSMNGVLDDPLIVLWIKGVA